MKKIAISLLLVAALVISAMAFTANAQENIAPNDVCEYAKNTLVTVIPNDGSGKNISAWCPACNKTVTWESYTTKLTWDMDMSNRHFYLHGNAENTKPFAVTSGTGCYYLNGFNMTNTANAAFKVSGGTLNIIAKGNETVTAYGTGDSSTTAVYGDVVHMSGGTLNLFGGTYQKLNTWDAGAVIGGEAAYTFNMYNGTTLSGGTSNGWRGGNICANYSGTKINIYGGTITGGKSANGGNIYAVSGTEINISGGSITGGTATSQGGNIMTKGTLSISGSASISGGSSQYGGGNIYLTGGASATMTGGTVSGGVDNQTNYGGGNFAVENASLNVTGGTISGGQAASAGGNIYIFAYFGSYGVTIGGNATIENGTATYGGNIYNLGQLTVTGGTFTNAESTAAGANLNAKSGSVNNLSNASFTGGNSTNIYASSAITATNCTITAGDSYTFYNDPGVTVTLNNCTLSNTGNNVYYADGDVVLNGTSWSARYAQQRKGKVTLAGNANAKFLIGTDATLHVKDTFTGAAYFDGIVAAHVSGKYLLESKATCDDPFLGTLVAETLSMKQFYGSAQGKLIEATARIVTKGNDWIWCGDVADAIKKWNEDCAFIVPNNGDVPVIIPDGATAILNLNGDKIKTAQVGEGAKVYVYDVNAGSNYGYISLGSIATDKVEKFFTAPDGHSYFAVTTDGVTRMHRIDVAITGLSLRPNAAGLYYTATVTGSEAAKAALNAGVAVKTGSEIGNDLTDTYYTQVKANSESITGMLVQNIVKGTDADATRAGITINAKAYLEYNGTVIMSEAKNYSLTGYMGLLNGKFANLGAQQEIAANFYQTYKGTAGWNCAAIEAYLAN